MAKTPAAMVEVGEREVRVSSPDRVVYEATGRTPEVTKLEVCQFFADVGEAFMKANGNRPVALERWPGGWREGMKLTVGPGGQQQGDGFYSKRLPKGAPDWVETTRVTTPNGRPIDELLITEPAAAVWAAHMGTLTFHPWAVRSGDVEHPDELRIDLDPQPQASFTDVRRVALLTRDLLAELGLKAFAKTSGNRGIHVYLRLAPKWSFEEVRHAAIGLGRALEQRDDAVTTNWWKEERPDTAVFVDFNQNLRDRTVAGAWSLRPRPGAPVSTPLRWEQLGELTDPREFHLRTVPDFLTDGDPWADIDDQQHSLEALLKLWQELPGGELNFPPDHPKMPGEPPRVQPSKKVAGHWDEDGNRAES
ncbi:DNA polymerase domain-containing protein [Parenemella sanctibonifatiensis]|uniref:ATP-dependent DNA ligase n=1 Tax=Parenemella sanctibonifatiensis TaxID=2016505 RepID=A0A255EI10_9ACTN|nr:DNA primase small subunit domain-containing protein [Parenemella sanctibonifatiensis]OYN91158.1 ATP-dependent DNA ligase [Parenemella sanctibonifatiensis]